MEEYYLNSKNNFIEGYYLPNLSICDELINLFEKSDNKTIGKTRSGVDKTIKDSLDLGINSNEIDTNKIFQSYFDEIVKCLNLYKDKYKFCNENVENWGLEERFNIQRYKPNQAFHHWHSETEWYYQKLKVKPEKGLTFIWSADWTFTHKGHTTINEDKYIITGWYDFKK